MDTIEISLGLKGNLGMDLVQGFINEVNGLRSPHGYTFCDVLEVSRKGNIIIKISYPRYFFGNNAYLINSKSACFEVQRYFAKNIMENEYWKQNIGELRLLRVDIPFTYVMNSYEEFNSYRNIFYIFAYVYDRMKHGARAKAYLDMFEEKYETLTYSDNGKVGKSSNDRLMIYNQWENLHGKLPEDIFEEAVKAYPDLPQRMRLEVSKRVRLRNEFNSSGFANLDILGNYFESYKKYILQNVLNFQIIDELYNQWSIELSQELIKQKAERKINYEVFILQNISNIHDYEILRRALGTAVENGKTRESAVTKVRKILNNEQGRSNIIVIDTYAVLVKMWNVINNYQLVD